MKNVATDPFATAGFLVDWLRRRKLAARKLPSVVIRPRAPRFSLDFHGEQAPNPASRVTLLHETDHLGLQKINIDWRYGEQDLGTVETAFRLLEKDLRKSGRGRLHYTRDGLRHAALRDGAFGGHHVGTARMASSEATGVVDSDCRVFGTRNVYVASSAVFPTSSQANPTLTIVAMALRLADHLKAEMAKDALRRSPKTTLVRPRRVSAWQHDRGRKAHASHRRPRSERISRPRRRAPVAGRPDVTVVACVRRNARFDASASRSPSATPPTSTSCGLCAKAPIAVVNAVMGRPGDMIAATRNVCDAAAAGPATHRASLEHGRARQHDRRARRDGALRPHDRQCLRRLQDRVRGDRGGGGHPRGIHRHPSAELHLRAWQRIMDRTHRAVAGSTRLGDLGAAGDGMCNLIHVEDAAHAVVAALSVAAAAASSMSPTRIRPAGTTTSSPSRAHCGQAPSHHGPPWRAETKLLAVPLKLAQMLGARCGVGRLMPDPVTPSFARLIGQDITLDVTARDVLGIQTRPLDRGIADSAAWLEAQGFTPRRRDRPAS